MFKKINIFKVILIIMLLIILFDNFLEYNEGRNLSKLLDEYMNNENYTEHNVSISITDGINNEYYSLDDKALVKEVLNYIKELKPTKLQDTNLYQNKGEESKNYWITIDCRYYITEKKENYTLREQKTDKIHIEIIDYSVIYVSCNCQTNYKENYSNYYKLTPSFDEKFIYDIIEKFNMTKR